MESVNESYLNILKAWDSHKPNPTAKVGSSESKPDEVDEEFDSKLELLKQDVEKHKVNYTREENFELYRRTKELHIYLLKNNRSLSKMREVYSIRHTIAEEREKRESSENLISFRIINK